MEQNKYFSYHELTEFLKFMPMASFVETDMMSGLLFLRCAFAAMRTDVSVIPFVSLAMVFPVQGAMTSASR